MRTPHQLIPVYHLHLLLIVVVLLIFAHILSFFIIIIASRLSLLDGCFHFLFKPVHVTFIVCMFTQNSIGWGMSKDLSFSQSHSYMPLFTTYNKEICFKSVLDMSNSKESKSKLVINSHNQAKR